MKKLSKKTIMLFASVMVMAAFVMPSLAGAATWSAPGTITGHSSSMVFTENTVNGAVNFNCTVRFDGNAVNTAGVAGGSITSATFGAVGTPCVGSGTAGAGCVVDMVATGLPWAITTSGTTVTISGIQASHVWTGSCPIAGWTYDSNGSLTGEWANGSGTANTLTLSNAGPLDLTVMGFLFGTAALDGSFAVTGPHL